MKTLHEAYTAPQDEIDLTLFGPRDEEYQVELVNKIKAKRIAAINAAMPFVPVGHSGYIAILSGLVNYSDIFDKASDQIRMLCEKIPFKVWIGLYKAFISDDFTDGDLYRFMKAETFSNEYEKEMKIYFMWK